MNKLFFSLSILLAACANNSGSPATNPTTEVKLNSTTSIGEDGKVISLSDYERYVKTTPIVLVDFSATWCGPCKKLAPRLDELVNEMPGKFTLVKSDVDRDSDLADSMNITAMPTLILYKNGKPIWRNEGLLEKSDVESQIESAEKN